MEDLLARIEAAEKRIAALEQKAKEREADAVEVIKADLRRRGVYGAKFFTTPSNYYDWTLEERAAFLGGDVSQLCKSIIFENIACDHNNCDDPTNSRFYCVIVQYVAKINTTMLRNFVHSLRPVASRLSKNSFNFQLASEEQSFELSGFGHNAISPYGMKVRNIPVIVCHRCTAEVQSPLLYLGGGKVDVKLLVSVNDILRSLNAMTGLITDPR